MATPLTTAPRDALTRSAHAQGLTLAQALALGRELLAPASGEAALEAELLLMEVTNLDRTALYSRLSSPLEPGRQANFGRLLAQRQGGSPLPYILGRREFYGLEMHVDERVLIPRPETELVVEEALAWLRCHYPVGLRAADVGTGSGAIAVALAYHLPGLRLFGTDVSRTALEVATRNCVRHGVAGRVHLAEGDLLAPIRANLDLVVANLPYIPSGRLGAANPGAWEPNLALDGGPDGTVLLRRLLREAAARLRPGGCLILELDHDQATAIAALARSLLPSAAIATRPDLAGFTRLLKVELAA